MQQREFGGDPAADGVADQGDVLEVESVEQVAVERGEAADAVEAVRARRAGEPGVSRGDHLAGPVAGQEFGEGGDRVGPGAAVQQEVRAALAAPVEGEVRFHINNVRSGY